MIKAKPFLALAKPHVSLRAQTWGAVTSCHPSRDAIKSGNQHAFRGTASGMGAGHSFNTPGHRSGKISPSGGLTSQVPKGWELNWVA